MSSNDHKKFKTDATQKASTDTEIISDAIILPPYSTDHVLTVTAPSSTSNLTGQVDVEVEMSPDGENWCALQTEETITTQGGGTSTPGANAEDANLKAVSTVPDSNHNTGQYKNKFALGNLAYDDSGNETAVNQGSKDFMHQFISKDKPFNYSLWYKTDTDAQAFGDDYTPVLFRHGGKDKFTNSNVVQLTDSITLFEEDAYAEMPTDGPIVYEADFPISNVEGTTWYLGLSRAFTPGYNGSPEDNGGFSIEIGDKVAGNYIKWEVRDTDAATSFFVNGTAVVAGLPNRSSRPNYTYSNSSNYSVPNTLWLCHPAWSGTQSSFYLRYQLFSSDTPCYRTEQSSQSLPTSLDDPLGSNTTNKITVTFDSSTQATRVLRNLILYTTDESTLFDTAQGDRRSVKFNSPLAGKELGDTPIASWNFGLNSNGVIKDGAGSNDMSVTYSGSQTIEKTGLKNIIGSSVIRKSFTGANKQIKFNGTGPFGGTNGGVPSLAGGWAAAFDPAVIVSTNTFNARLIQLYTGASTSFNIRRNQSAINVVINGVTHTMSGIDIYTGAFLVVCEPYTLDGVTSISSKLTTYYIPKEVNLHTATISDLVAVPCTINATAYGSDWAFNPSSSYSYLITDQTNGARLNTSAFFNTGTTSLTDQDKLDILIGMEMPSLVNLNNLNVGLTGLYNYNTNYDGTYLYDETGSGVNPYASVPSGLNISSRESLQDGTPSTQNLCEPLQTPSSLNTLVLEGISSTSTTQPDFNLKPLGTNASTNISVFPELSDFYSTTLTSCAMGNLSDPRSISFWIKIDSLVANHTAVWQQGSGAGGSIGITVYNGTVRLQFQHSAQATGADYSQVVSSTIPINTWTHITFRKTTGTTGATLEAIVNGDIVNKTTATMPSGGSVNLTRWTTSNQITYSRFSSYLINVANGNAYRGTCAIQLSDFMGFKDYLHDDEVNSLYNQGNVIDPTSIPVAGNVDIPSKIDSWFKFGDGATDVVDTATPSYKSYNQITNAYRTSVGRPTIHNDPSGQYIENNTAVTGPSFSSLSVNDPIYSGYTPTFTSIFTSTSSFSISGWFKTTDTGTLLSNGPLASLAGLNLDITSSTNIDLKLGVVTPISITSSVNLNDGNWHHILLTKNNSGVYNVYINSILMGTVTDASTDPKGSYGFTLLGDGQNNATAASPAATDVSKLNASLSNWSIHSEALDQYAAKQLYSNGHVRNIKNLPSINSGNIVAWWQLNNGASPEQDLSGNGYNLVLQDVNSLTLSDYVLGLTDGAPLIVEEDQYGSGITMSITKRFDVINNEWTNVHTHPTCICLSFNGFEDQAEYFAIYNPDTLDVANNAWHHTSLSFSGKEGSSTNNTVNFCFDSATHNFVLSIDGNNYTTAHFVGGFGGPITNKCFPAEERHLKFVTNDQEDYMPHAQLNSNIFESINQTDKKYEPVVLRDYKTSFIGYADESSFHSESWFTDETGTPTTSFNDQKTATLYGSTSTLSNRGVNSTIFTIGKPYPLRRPSIIGASTSTGNQYIDPNKYNASTNADGGLEAWWRWGDTVGDCSENINDAVGFESDPIDGHRSLKARNYISEEVDTDNDGIPDTPRDLIILTETDSIYVAEGSTSTGGGECTSVAYLPAIIENIQAGICNIKNLTLPVLQYIRIKFTNSGEAQLGKDKVEASIHYRKRR